MIAAGTGRGIADGVRHTSRLFRPAPMAPPVDVTGRTFVVTGATPGSLGYEVVRMLARWGGQVVATCLRDPVAMGRSLNDDLAALPRHGDVAVRRLDLADRASVEAFARFTEEHFAGRLHVLVSNAGILKGMFAGRGEPRTRTGRRGVRGTRGVATSRWLSRSGRMAGEGGERLYCMYFEVSKDGAHVVPAPVLVDSMTNIQRLVYLLAKFTRGEELGQRASFSRPLREAFALQCRAPEPGSYAMPFEIGGAEQSAVAGEAEDVGGLFRRVTAAVGHGDLERVRTLVPDVRYLDCLGHAYRKATPASRSGVSYWIEDSRRRKILDSRKSEAMLRRTRSNSGM